MGSHIGTAFLSVSLNYSQSLKCLFVLNCNNDLKNRFYYIVPKSTAILTMLANETYIELFKEIVGLLGINHNFLPFYSFHILITRRELFADRKHLNICNDIFKTLSN